MTLQERLERSDWKDVAMACKFAARGRCQTCSKRFPYPFHGLHAHHNNYERLGNELPSDLIALCSICHATFHWAKENFARVERDTIKLWEVSAVKQMRLTDIEDRYRQEKREIQNHLDQAEFKLQILAAMTEYGDLGNEWERRLTG